MTNSLPTVLIVEDEQYINNALKDIFEDADMDVFACLTGCDAIQTLKNNPIDVCIVDMRLPDITGNDFIIEAHKISPCVRYIIYTGSVGYSLPKNLREIGVKNENVYHKPDDLKSIVDAAVNIYRQN